MRHYVTIVLCAALLGIARPASAQDRFYLKMESLKQGSFKPIQQRAKGDGFMECTGFNFDNKVPIDAGNAQTRGARSHDPLKVTISTSVASPQILQASWAHQVLSSVQMEMTHTVGGKEQLFMRLTLKNAAITAVDINKDTEVVSFQYEQMTVETNPVN